MDALTEILAGLDSIRPELTAFYQDLHRNPELSMQETRTAAKAADILRAEGYTVGTGIGKTGVVGILDNGVGPTVLLRADMDALPVREQTGLAYASTATGVDPDGEPVPLMHACGHDLHVTCLCGAAALLARNRDRWRGRLMMVFQPAEEIGSGARAMINDGLFDRFGKPEVVLGQHVIPSPAGSLYWRTGITMSAADSFEIKLFGRGGHGSRPQSSIDPIVMAASLVLRLQTIVAREVAPSDQVVVTVGSLHAGTKENIIPDQATIKINVRSFSPPVRQRVLDAIKRIAVAEAAASDAPRAPEFRPLNNFPILTNDPEATGRTVNALGRHFGDDKIHEVPLVNASEDFGEFGVAAGVPSVFWYFGGLDPEIVKKASDEGRLDEIPSNHSPLFAPIVEPTLTTGVHALVAGALNWLSAK
ncbi:MAG TPA: amidohydrolase [Candidatus Binataceae bacterium]|nr:amidohydrolase [Candidatus Binataceae bacterium]